jgi:hypothetical protein
MRKLIAFVVVLAAACHPPTLQDRARQAGAKVSAAGHRIANVVVRANVSVDPAVKAQLTDLAVAAATAQAQTAVARASAGGQGAASDPQPVAQASSSSSSATTVAVRNPDPVPMTVHRVDAAPPATFAAHYKTASGAWTCAAHPTMADCIASCTAMMRTVANTRGADPQCNCVEGASCP